MIYRKVLATCLCILILSSTSYAQNPLMQSSAEQAYIIDFETGTILFEKNSDKKMPTSSMSKVMTMYMVFDALKKGNLSLDDTFLVSEKAWRKGGSKMFVPVGEQVRVEDLIRGVIIQSGNDATIVLAEGVAGDELNFAAALNSKAKELGMNNSHFTNASGWPDPDHYSTAEDLAILASAMIKEFPEYYGYYAEPEFTYNKITQNNRNPLLSKNIGADGLKTGHTEVGGYGLIGTGVKDGRRVVMVLNGMESSKERATESTRLLQWALNGFRNVTLFEKALDLEQAQIRLGAKNTVKIGAQNEFSVTVPKLFENDLKVEIEYETPLKAPLKKGAIIGEIRVHIPKGEVVNLPLVALESVGDLGFFSKLFAKASLLISGEGVIR